MSKKVIIRKNFTCFGNEEKKEVLVKTVLQE